jgi:hypothetical protein
VCDCSLCQAYREALHVALNLLHQSHNRITLDHQTIASLRGELKTARRIMKTAEGIWIFFAEDEYTHTPELNQPELTDLFDSIRLPQGPASTTHSEQAIATSDDGTQGAEGPPHEPTHDKLYD